MEKPLTKTINLKYQLQRGKKKLHYLTDHSISDIQEYFKYINKKHEIVTKNLPIRIYINEI